jgi:hypothetical protein
MDMSNESEPNVPSNEKLILHAAAEVVDHTALLVRRERTLRRLRRAFRVLGISAITGKDWVQLDEGSADIRFGTVPADRLSMLCDFFDDLAVLVEDRSSWVPAPIVGGINVSIENLHVQLNIFDKEDPTHD